MPAAAGVTSAASIVIGADGLRSTIAERVDAPIERAGRGASAVVYGYWRNLPTDGYQWVFRPNATAGLIPTNDDLTCVFVAATPARIGTGRLNVLHDILAEAAPDVAARLTTAHGPTGLRAFAGQPGYMRRSWGPGWALVGDAGYWKDPLAAHGLTDALRDAELLARAISTSDATNRLDALADYQATRDRLSIPHFDVVDTIAAQRWTDAEIPHLLRQLSASMTDEVETLATLDAVPVP